MMKLQVAAVTVLNKLKETLNFTLDTNTTKNNGIKSKQSSLFYKYRLTTLSGSE